MWVMLTCMEQYLLTPDPKLTSPVQISEHGVDVLRTVLLNSNKGTNLCAFVLTSIS